MMLKKIFEKHNSFSSLKDLILFDFPLAPELSFQVGGNADVIFEPRSIDEVKMGLKMFSDLHVPVSIIGAGSNLLVSDCGIRGVVMRLNRFDNITFKIYDDYVFVEAGAGVLTEDFSKFCAENSIVGFETFAGLPGSIGGAVFMNARCYNHSISDFFFSANVIKMADSFNLVQHKFNANEWDYKLSPFQGMPYGIEVNKMRQIICSVTFKLKKGDRKLLESERNKYIHDREAKGHFKKPSAGSTFKNNRNFGKPSGKIIDELGLKGLSIGNAQVAPWHGNLIINNGNASADEIRTLIETVSSEVLKKTGFKLEQEVVFAGDWKSKQ